MLTLFWDEKGHILDNYLDRETTVNSKVVLLQDKPRLHTAYNTIETINRLGFDTLEHPTCSPDLIPSEFHLFEQLMETLISHRFASDMHTWDTMQNLLND
ncbi:hypothetical protein NPIL_415081 [Nephila pilipes]|uniref:Tc1-like transposase DDE domain-containing protein n=1 Tax=Nephila pilipes TaxID=299642 RepID=A0A8X6MCY5_NEPPI|nr:hypothetical protein NPIL_415081 [Nephila pilipes]